MNQGWELKTPDFASALQGTIMKNTWCILSITERQEVEPVACTYKAFLAVHAAIHFVGQVLLTLALFAATSGKCAQYGQTTNVEDISACVCEHQC